MSDKLRLISLSMDCLSKTSWRVLASYTWLFCAFALLFLGLGTLLVEPEGKLFPPILLVLMIFLSFPSGFGVFLLTWPFIDLFPPLDFFLVWLAIVVAGYIQWFRVLLEINEGPITLSIDQAQPVIIAPQAASPAEQSPKRKRLDNIVHFDARGRTPLERALIYQSRKSKRELTEG